MPEAGMTMCCLICGFEPPLVSFEDGSEAEWADLVRTMTAHRVDHHEEPA